MPPRSLYYLCYKAQDRASGGAWPKPDGEKQTPADLKVVRTTWSLTSKEHHQTNNNV
jgi:hypothetical protein